MTNPNDPWSVRPDNQPTEQFGRPGDYDEHGHTSDPYQAYGYMPEHATYQYPVYETYDPNRPPSNTTAPNPTLAYPTYGSQWGGQPGEMPPGAQPGQRPGGEPPRRNVALWVAVGACAVLLVAVIVAGFLLFGPKNNSSDTASAATSAPTSAPPIQDDPSMPNDESPTMQAPLSAPPQAPGLPGAGGSDTGAAIGTIKSNAGGTLTVDQIAGGAVTVRTDSNTRVISLSGDKVADLKVGDAVVVQGDKKGDGSVLATMIIATGLPNLGGNGGGGGSGNGGGFGN